MAVFECKLPDFCSSRKVTVKAYVDDNAIGEHDIIFGKRFCAELGIIMNYKTRTIVWDDLSIPMVKTKQKQIVNALSDDPGDEFLPEFMKKATYRL